MIPGCVPPADLDTEAVVLAQVLVGKIDRVADILNAEDYYSDANGLIYSTALDLHQRGTPVDTATVVAALRDHGQLDKVGGAKYVAELYAHTPSVYNVEVHARVVKTKAKQRRMIELAHTIAAEGYGDIGELGDWMGSVEKRVYELSSAGTTSTIHHVAPIVGRVYTEAAEVMEGKTQPGISTGLLDFDRIIGGLKKKTLTILAARPGMGKSALASEIAIGVACQPKGVAIFSLEMGSEELVKRMLSSEAQVDLSQPEFYKSKENWGKTTEAAGIIARLPVWVDDSPGIRPMDLMSRSRRVQKEAEKIGRGLSLIVVDYLQLMNGHGKNKNGIREQEISEISRSLKQLSKDFDVPVIALSQLNRQLESRENKRPMLSDLRESGAIEQDADVVVFLYREDYYTKRDTPEHKKGIAEIIVAKQRGGRTGTALVKWDGRYTKFSNLAQHAIDGYFQ